MKGTLLIPLLLLLALSTYGQQPDYIAEMMNSHHSLMQREGTEQQMKELLGPYGKGCNEVFAILFTPQSCPRCEADIPFFIHNMPKLNPQAQVVLIAAYPEADMAREYVKQKFGFDHLIVESNRKHEQIFRYRTGKLAVTYVLRIDAKQGRLLCGGDSPNMNLDFLQQLMDYTDCMPMYKEPANVTASLSDKHKPTGTYPAVRIGRDGEVSVSGILGLPVWAGNQFFYSDELVSQGLLFDVQGDSVAVLRQRIHPTASQEKAFVDIPDSVYDKMKRDGQIFIMANEGNIEPESGTVIISYSLPELSYKDKETIAYYNQAVLLQTSLSADTCTMLPLDALRGDKYFYITTSQIIPIGEGRLMMGCLTGYPTIMTAEESKRTPKRDLFRDSFYAESPFCAIFDMRTGQLLKRFGQLDDIFRRTHTGYYFAMPTGDCDGKQLVYTDGCSGKIWLTDKDAADKGREMSLFDVSVPDSVLHVAQPDAYTDEYFNHYLTIFNRYIEALKLDERGIHCLVRHGTSAIKTETDIYEYKVLTREGHEQYTTFLQTEDGDELLAVSLGKDKNGHVFPYYVCRNKGNCYLKRLTAHHPILHERRP